MPQKEKDDTHATEYFGVPVTLVVNGKEIPNELENRAIDPDEAVKAWDAYQALYDFVVARRPWESKALQLLDGLSRELEHIPGMTSANDGSGKARPSQLEEVNVYLGGTPESEARILRNHGYRQFERGTNPGTVVCDNCGRRTWAGRARNQAGFCKECSNLMGLENEASDNGDEAKAKEYRARIDARRKAGASKA